jgi:hypothetical protein
MAASKERKKNWYWILAGIVVAILLIAARQFPGTQDPYLEYAPPPGPNARPDPPNPDKVKRLPGAAAPEAPGPTTVEATQVK